MLKNVRYFDFYLVGLAFSLTAFGIVAISSATVASGRSRLATQQVKWFAIGVVAMLLATTIDYQKVIAHAGLFYGMTTGLLIALMAYGKISKGAQRWLDLGFFRFQPSEIAKVTLALMLAKYIAAIKHRHLRLRELSAVAIICGVPVALIALQPDLGTAVTLIPIGFAAAFLGGIRARYYVILGLVLLVAVPTVYVFGLRNYQRERIQTFLNPENDPQDAGWQVRQSLIAVGSGGMSGKGHRQGSQTSLKFVPEQHTDFVFTVWGEEFGFLGTGIAITAYLLLTLRVLGTSMISRDAVGTLICAGFASLVGFQALANLCMVISLIPTTGIPLPFMSYGGSSLLTTFLFLGLVLNVRMRRYEIR